MAPSLSKTPNQEKLEMTERTSHKEDPKHNSKWVWGFLILRPVSHPWFVSLIHLELSVPSLCVHAWVTVNAILSFLNSVEVRTNGSDHFNILLKCEDLISPFFMSTKLDTISVSWHRLYFRLLSEPGSYENKVTMSTLARGPQCPFYRHQLKLYNHISLWWQK